MTDEVEGFDKINCEDKEKIQSMLKTARDNIETVLADYSVEYAKSGSSKCGICEEVIKQGEVRIGKKIHNTRMAKLNGPYDRWHHLQCFAEKAHDLEYYKDGEELPGISSMSEDDKKEIRSKIKGSKKRSATKDDVESAAPKKVRSN